MIGTTGEYPGEYFSHIYSHRTLSKLFYLPELREVSNNINIVNPPFNGSRFNGFRI